MRKESLLTLLILLGVVAGAAFGQFFLFDQGATADFLRQKAEPFQQAGDLVFIRPLTMLVIPLVLLSVATGVASIGSPSKLGLVGGATVLYFIGTTLLAVLLGLAIVNLVQPGRGVSPDLFAGAAHADYAANIAARVEAAPDDVGGAFMNVAHDLIPSSVVSAAAGGNVLGVAVFALVLGVALAVVGRPAAPAIAAMEGLLAGLMKIVGWVTWLAPVGAFLLVAAGVGRTGLQSLAGPLRLYVLCVVVGLAIHGFILLPLLLWALARVNPYVFTWRIRRVLLVAFATASSSASLPVTIESCRTAGGCSKLAATFVPSLGAGVNTNGTALYEAVAVAFLFQMFKYDLTLTEQLAIVATATLSAIGAAGIPGVGLVTMAIVISAVNSSLASGPAGNPPLPLWAIGFVYGVDRFLDMCRTTINVFGDAVGARIITRLSPDDDRAPSRHDAESALGAAAAM